MVLVRCVILYLFSLTPAAKIRHTISRNICSVHLAKD